MNKPHSFSRDIGHYLTGRAALIGLGFVAFPLMTRMLSVSDYGRLSLVLRIILLLTVLSKCGLQYSSARFYEAAGPNGLPEQKRQFYSTLVFGPTLSALALACIYLPVVLLSRQRLADPLLYHCLLLAPVLVSLRTLQSLLLSFLRNEGRSALHSTLEVASKILTLVALVLLFVSGFKTGFAVLASTTLCEGIIVLLQLTELVKRKLLHPSAVHWKLIRTSFLFGAPLIGYELASIVLDSGDRLLIRHFLGDTPLGFYSAAYNVSGYLQDTVMTPLNLAIFPVYMRLWKQEGREATQRFLSQSLSWFTVVAVAITTLSVLCSKDAVVLLASSRFLEAHRLLPILVPGLLLYASHIFLNVGLILEKRTVLLAVLVAGTALFNLGLNLYLIPRLGISGAAWATLLSYAAFIAVLTWINSRILPLRPDLALMAQSVAAAIVAYLPSVLIHTHYSIGTLVLRVPVFLSLFSSLLLIFSPAFRTFVVEHLPELAFLKKLPSKSSTGCESAVAEIQLHPRAEQKGSA